MEDYYFKHKSYGTLWFDPLHGTKHFDPWWALLKVDKGTIDYYRWLLKSHGIHTMPNKLWGPHVSVIKGCEPKERQFWGADFGLVEFWYSNYIRWDNGRHAWLDVFCPQMNDIRLKLGIYGKSFFHMTLGIIK